MIDAIVLKKQPYQESSELVTLFTREYGKLNVIAKGSKKPSSPLFAALQPYQCGSFDLRIKESGLNSVYQGEIKQLYTVSISLLAQVGYAYLAELLLYCFDERIALPTLYDVMVDSYKLLEDESAIYYVLARYLFVLQKVIDEPLQYKHCANCLKKEAPMVGFSFSNRGFICKNCESYLTHPIEKNVMPLLVHLERNSKLDEEAMAHEHWQRLFEHFQVYYKEQLGIQPKSAHILKQLRK